MTNETQVTVASIFMWLWLTVATGLYFIYVSEYEIWAFFFYILSTGDIGTRWRKIIQGYTDDLVTVT